MASICRTASRSTFALVQPLQWWDDWNIMQPFRFGGLQSLGNKVSVPIRPDKDGYLGRECPNPECEEYFKITPGTGIKGSAPCHCPYCGHTGESKTFWTRNQIEYARSVVKQKVIEAVRQDLKALEFEHKPRGPFGIGISMKLQPGAPVPIRWYREKSLETETVCDQCGLRYAIYGVFGWCPDCGVHNSLQILATNLELARKKLTLAVTAGDLAEAVIADALAGVVAAFDGFGRELCAGCQSKVSFQGLDGGRKRVLEQHGFDFADAVTEEEWRSACRSFQKRHLLAHRMGVIDDDYIRKTCDASAVVGRKITLASEEITALIDIIERIGKRLYVGTKARPTPENK
jgi:hypothetical protein